MEGAPSVEGRGGGGRGQGRRLRLTEDARSLGGLRLRMLLLQLARSMSLRNRRVVVVGGAVGRED